MQSTKQILRVWLRVQALLLCLTLAAVGAVIAAERTQYLAEGTAAAVQSVSPLETAARRVPDMPDGHTLLRAAAALPAPLGGIAAVICSIQNILEYANLT